MFGCGLWMRGRGSILVADNILDLELFPFDAAFRRVLALTLIVLLILRRYLALLLLLTHLEFYKTVLSLILIRVTGRRPSKQY